MNKIIKFFKRIFGKKVLLLGESESTAEAKNIDIKNSFLNNIKIEDINDTLLTLQIKLENGDIDEKQLNNDQVEKIKSLYYEQVLTLINSVKKYKLKLVQD